MFLFFNFLQVIYGVLSNDVDRGPCMHCVVFKSDGFLQGFLKISRLPQAENVSKSGNSFQFLHCQKADVICMTGTGHPRLRTCDALLADIMKYHACGVSLWMHHLTASLLLI